nr:hypothetical protein [Paenibacillus bovis]
MPKVGVFAAIIDKNERILLTRIKYDPVIGPYQAGILKSMNHQYKDLKRSSFRGNGLYR